MNQFGEATANVNLNIEADPEPKGQAPVFVEKPTIKFEEKAGRVLMEAVVRADPQPTSRWTKDAKELDGSRVTATVTREKEDCYRIRLELRVTWQPAPSSLPNSPASQPASLSHASQSACIMHHHACLALALLPAYVWPISYLCRYNILFFSAILNNKPFIQKNLMVGEASHSTASDNALEYSRYTDLSRIPSCFQ